MTAAGVQAFPELLVPLLLTAVQPFVSVSGRCIVCADPCHAGVTYCVVTLFCAYHPTPLSQVHGGKIVDIAWTPDGYTLIAASHDDRVSVLRCARMCLLLKLLYSSIGEGREVG